jgi:outer membrane protein assembly factor BamB
MPGGLGFVSMLGCQVYCEDEGDCMLVTTDFAGGLRMYMLDGTLVYDAETTYTSGAATGALSIDESASEVYITGFFNETTPGVVMRFDLATGKPKPTEGLKGAIYIEDEGLVRPIGILLVPEEEPTPELLVGNTRADNIVIVSDELSIAEFIGDVPNPDHLVVYEDTLYLSAGDTGENSAIYAYSNGTLSVFAEGGGLMRPYGFAFDGGILYVASFMTDQILTYDASTGEYIGVFAETDGTEEGLCNGPNHIAIFEGSLYLTTQGSNVVNGSLTYLFAR